MKKPIFIIIGIVYIASIVIVSMFGLAVKIYGEKTPVTEIECINTTNAEYEVVEDIDGSKIIYMDFTTPGNLETMTGTILLLNFRVGPDNATDKRLKYIYARENYPQVTFHKVNDEEKGLIAFSGPALLTVVAQAMDGSGVKSEPIHISVR